MRYEELLMEADSNNLITKEKALPMSKGRIKGTKIAIRKSLTCTEKACIMAEELGHYYTSSGNIMDQNDTSNRKQEYHARLWSYNKLVGLHGIISCYKNNCRNLHDMAENLQVTEEFLLESLDTYRRKYGVCTRLDNYIIYFEPYLSVVEII